jgi:hypothetical protein
MTQAQMFIANAAWVGILITILGLVVRRRLSLCWSFVVYLTACLVTNRLIAWWPATFWNVGFYATKEFGLILLKIAVSVELTLLLLVALRRARRTAVAVIAAIGLAGCLAPIALVGELATAHRAPLYVIVSAFGVLSVAALWAVVAFVVVAEWYHLPVHRWHRDIVIGFVLYGGVYSVLLGLAGGLGSKMYDVLVVVDPCAYAATVALWAVGAWRTSTPLALGAKLRELQPWAQR